MVSQVLYEAIRHEYDIVREELDLPYQRIGWVTAAAAVLGSLIAAGFRGDLLSETLSRVDVFMHAFLAASCCVSMAASIVFCVRATWPVRWRHASGMAAWMDIETDLRQLVGRGAAEEVVEFEMRERLCATYAQVVDKNRPVVKQRGHLTKRAMQCNGFAVILGIAFLPTVLVLQMTSPERDSLERKESSMVNSELVHYERFSSGWVLEDPKQDPRTTDRPVDPMPTDDDDRAGGDPPNIR
jgi:hypothetical protein